MNKYHVAVIGGGPAGLAAAIEASKTGAEVILIERENRLGGVLKQCIHDGFGLVRFEERLSGCEYSHRFIEELEKTSVEVLTFAFVSSITQNEKGFEILLSTAEGMKEIHVKSIVLATGCRERTAKQVAIHGSRPSGIITAGAAQHFVNLMGQLPGKNCVILGSGDIGLIMARRLTLEGANVIGVYEAKSEPGGLSRNIYQCLDDFNIPLHLSTTVIEAHGRERLTSVTVAKVDEDMNIIRGTEEEIPCDTLILSVGLIPENELALKLNIEIDPKTKGPFVDQSAQTSLCGVFSCGNALHVNDLVDYVSVSGEIAGKNAALYALQNDVERNSSSVFRENTSTFEIKKLGELSYIVPQRINPSLLISRDKFEKSAESKFGDLDDVCLDLNNTQAESLEASSLLSFFFRVRRTLGKSSLTVTLDGKEIFKKRFLGLKPPEMEYVEIDFSESEINPDSKLEFKLVELNR